MPVLTVADVMTVLADITPPHLKLPDDPVGLLVGDPAAPVTRVVVALDATLAVARAAAEGGGPALIVAHHPLVYHALKTVRADDPIGAVVLACAQNNVAVAAAHTNWDVAPGGINDVLANLLGLSNVRPLQITYREPLVNVTVFVPPADRDRVFDAMAGAGAGAIGDYDRCGFFAPGTGTFRPLPGANPHVGRVGNPEFVAEERLEMIVPETKAASVVAAMKAAHPYEEVAHFVFPLRNTHAEFGIGRVGTLASSLGGADFLQHVKNALGFPEVRMAGPGEKNVRTVAVCGGAGAFLMNDALAVGADAFVTSDVRHHEFVEAQARGLLLLDAGHAQTETPGTRELARRLAAALAERGDTVPVAFAEPNGALLDAD
jgi:dinuclear metal center YbgI/SA1388 family protein